MDFNVGKQCATTFVKRGVEDYHAVDELVDMLDTPTAIETINAKYPNSKINIYPDASGGARKSVGASTTDIELLRNAGYNVVVNRSNPKVKDRILTANSAFANTKCFVNIENCPNTVECLEQQAYDANGLPDKKSGKDHQNDATTYPLMHLLPIKKKPLVINSSFYNGYK